uniref:Secreted protein n=1 Tax=Romanomermis culicivorax TaxID=13658 RepID=A0A915JJW2_ROMCU
MLVVVTRGVCCIARSTGGEEKASGTWRCGATLQTGFWYDNLLIMTVETFFGKSCNICFNSGKARSINVKSAGKPFSSTN